MGRKRTRPPGRVHNRQNNDSLEERKRKEQKKKAEREKENEKKQREVCESAYCQVILAAQPVPAATATMPKQRPHRAHHPVQHHPVIARPACLPAACLARTLSKIPWVMGSSSGPKKGETSVPSSPSTLKLRACITVTGTCTYQRHDCRASHLHCWQIAIAGCR